MHKQSESDLKKLAALQIEKANGDIDDARRQFMEEAKMRFSLEDDGNYSAYLTDAATIFLEAERLDHNQQCDLEAD